MFRGMESGGSDDFKKFFPAGRDGKGRTESKVLNFLTQNLASLLVVGSPCEFEINLIKKGLQPCTQIGRKTFSETGIEI